MTTFTDELTSFATRLPMLVERVVARNKTVEAELVRQHNEIETLRTALEGAVATLQSVGQVLPPGSYRFALESLAMKISAALAAKVQP